MIYRNDNLKITDEEVTGKVKDVKEYFRYEVANQCMSFLSYEELIYNSKLIFDLIEELEEENDDLEIEVYFNPVGAYEYKKVELEQ